MDLTQMAEDAKKSREEKKHTDGDIGFLVVIMMIFAGGVSLGAFQEGINHTRREAIEAGVGKYVADEKTGDVRFEWINQPSSSPQRP